MPTYQYECAHCRHGFEFLQSMKDPKLRKCPKCGKFKLQRLIGAGGGVIFKGSGFYETDYKRKGVSSSEPAKPAGGQTQQPKASSCGHGSCGCGA